MKCVIFCGGKGTRLRGETEFKPKPLIEIGGRPILWHIMKIYSHFGIKEFILTLGYKGDMIKRYFMQNQWIDHDFTINLKSNKINIHRNHFEQEDWKVTCVDTGLESGTGLRLFKIKEYLEDEENFCLTYGDGVANIDITKKINFHINHGKIATITALHPRSKFGLIETDENDFATNFKEKPVLHDFINGGFMVFNKKVFEFMSDENCMIENTLLPKLSAEKQIKVHKFDGFWHCMDTYKDYEDLNRYWETNAPWKLWNDELI